MTLKRFKLSNENFSHKGGLSDEPCNLVARYVFAGSCSNGSMLPIHGSMRENLNGGDEDDLSDSGCSGIFICIPGCCACTAGMVLNMGLALRVESVPVPAALNSRLAAHDSQHVT